MVASITRVSGQLLLWLFYQAVFPERVLVRSARIQRTHDSRLSYEGSDL